MGHGKAPKGCGYVFCNERKNRFDTYGLWAMLRCPGRKSYFSDLLFSGPRPGCVWRYRLCLYWQRRRWRIFHHERLACFLLVGFSLFLRSIDANEAAPAVKNQVAASDMASADVAASQADSAVNLSRWYGNLGQSDADLESLEEFQFISYLLKKEDK